MRRPVMLPADPADLSPTARRLLVAARTLFERSGFEALSFEAIGQEAGLSPSLIRYHFGSKRELLVVLASSLMYDFTSDRFWPTVSPGEHHAGAEVVLRQEMRGLLLHLEAFRLFFQLLPHLLSDARSRALLTEMYRGLIALRAPKFAGDDISPADAELYVAMSMALTDGLAVLRLADPALVDVDRALEVWWRWIGLAIVRPGGPTPG